LAVPIFVVLRSALPAKSLVSVGTWGCIAHVLQEVGPSVDLLVVHRPAALPRYPDVVPAILAHGGDQDAGGPSTVVVTVEWLPVLAARVPKFKPRGSDPKGLIEAERDATRLVVRSVGVMPRSGYRALVLRDVRDSPLTTLGSGADDLHQNPSGTVSLYRSMYA
jgi:hypothetical protein